MSRPRLLDLFCKAGGATAGYQRAGFYVVGGMNTVVVRLQAGPFDGEKAEVWVEQLVQRIWVTKCWNCGTHWWAEEVKGGEPYRRDCEKDGVLVYVWEDENLRDVRAWLEETEVAPDGVFV